MSGGKICIYCGDDTRGQWFTVAKGAVCMMCVMELRQYYENRRWHEEHAPIRNVEEVHP